MNYVNLYRTSTNDQGTFGIITFAGQSLYTGELPWRDNKPNYSCIPDGVYTVQVRNSSKFGRCYEVKPVPKRSYILFHHGNHCGDRVRGYRTDIRGCILLGCSNGKLLSQRAVLNSRTARRRFETIMNFQPFQLEIINIGNYPRRMQ